MKKSYLLKSLFFCCFILLCWGIIDSSLISEAKTQVQLSDDSYNCQGCKCGRPYEADSCVRGDVKFCCNMVQALGNDQLKDNLVVIDNYVIDDDLRDIDLLGDPVSFSFEIQCVDAAGNKIDESNCNPSTKPTSCDVPEVNPTDKYYTVKFDCNGGSNPAESQSFKVGASQALSANTCSRTDYAFQGWSTTKGGTKAYDDKATVNLGGTAGSTITLYAVWAYSPGTYTVKFDCNGGSNAPQNQTFTVGASQALYANTCTRTNFTFKGWSTTKGGNKEYDDKATVNPGGTANSTITLYAVWQQQEKTYTVKFDCNGGSGTPPIDQTFTVGKSGKLNANTCTRTSPWSFKGWSKTKGGSKDYDNQATVDLGGTANSTITLYAVWQRTITPTSCPNGCFYAAAVDQCFKNSCFIAGTKVRMADGSEKNIEDISEGEMVLGANGEYNTVQGLHMPKLGSKKLWSINGGKNFFTEEHPFMTTEGWKAINSELAMQEIDLEVGELQVGDVLVTNNGYVVIKSLEGVEGDKDTQLYNLMLDGDHTYYADDYLVHNKLKMLEYLDGGECPRGTELRGAGCCPSNTWGKGSECVPLCDENPDPNPNPTTTTYSWTCVSDESQAYCDNNSSYQYCSEVNCHGNTPSSCYENYYLPKRGSRWGYLAYWDGAKCPGYPSVCEDGDTTWYRCCDWVTSVNKCESSKGYIVSDSYCSGQPQKDCSKFKEGGVSGFLEDPSRY